MAEKDEVVYIRAELSSPVICDRWIPLDSLIMAVLARINRFPPADVEDHTEELEAMCPIARHERGFFLASWGRGKVARGGRDISYTRTRYPLREGALLGHAKMRKILVAGGPYKSYNLPMRTQIVETIEWWARGDAEEIEHALSFCGYLGKKRSHGFGQVVRWSVQPAHHDYSLFYASPHLDFLRPSRALPVDLPELLEQEKSFTVGYSTLIPPYWRSEQAVPCAMPTDGIG